MEVIMIMVLVLALAGAVVIGTGPWPRDRWSLDDLRHAMNRSRMLAYRASLDQFDQVDQVRRVPTGPTAGSTAIGSERANHRTGSSPIDPVPTHVTGARWPADRRPERAPSSPPARPIPIPEPLRASATGLTGAQLQRLGAPPHRARAQVHPTRGQDRAELDGLRRLGTDPVLPAARIVEEAARVVGVFDDPGARDPAVEANARLTASTGVLLVALFFVEGLTIPVVGRFLAWHVAIGLALIPPVLLKIGSTLWRFVHYYLGDRRFVAAGPPHPVLRVLGPLVVISTSVLIASGVALWLVGPTDSVMFRVHQLTFVLWFGVVAVHLLAHVWRATRLVTADSRDARRRVAGSARARRRRLVVGLSLALGVALGLAGVTVTTGWSHPPLHGPPPGAPSIAANPQAPSPTHP